MKHIKKVLAVLLAAMLFCSAGMAAFAADGDDDDVLYSITWVYENETIVDQYHAGDTIVVREATLSDGSAGGWTTNPDAERAPMKSPVPETMPAEDLTFYATKSWTSQITDVVIPGMINRITEKLLSKEYWKEQHPLLWVFPYVWYHIVFFFGSHFHC